MKFKELSYANERDPKLKRWFIRSIEGLSGRDRFTRLYEIWRNDIVGKTDRVFGKMLDLINVDLKVQGEWLRAQLTWTSPRGGLFMFISANGLAHSMTRRTLEKLLGKDALRIISRGGVVEGALDAVAQQALRNAQEADPDTGL